MPFRPRNPYYLRISEKCVLPVFLYLDERHLDWMSDRTLQHVLEDLRPNILPKLQAETDMSSGHAKKATVETHRGETYQFCYFLRKTQPHSIVMKMRTFAAAPPRNQQPMAPPPIPPKRKPRAPVQPSESRKRRRQDDSSDDSDVDTEEGQTRRPTRSRKAKTTRVEGGNQDDDDVEMADDPDYEEENESRERRVKTVQFTLVPDDEEEKPKPILKLKYQGFNIFGHCLCIVVEPWPPIRALSRAPSIFRSTPAAAEARSSSIAPPEFVASVEARQRARSKTPLFLPDLDEEPDRGQTPYLGQDQDMLVIDDDDDEYGGMMQFSQVLHSAGDNRAGAADDDEDMEGAVLFGDADENREL